MFSATDSELQELRWHMQHAPKAYVRRKATALWNRGQGKTQREVAAFLDVSEVSLSKWEKRFRVEGAAGFFMHPGRGRKAKSEWEEVSSLIRQSPRNFGLPQTRWTLKALAQAAPSLRGFTASGVWRVLHRNGLSYKRGQPILHSPDPDYDAKRGA